MTASDSLGTLKGAIEGLVEAVNMLPTVKATRWLYESVFGGTEDATKRSEQKLGQARLKAEMEAEKARMDKTDFKGPLKFWRDLPEEEKKKWLDAGKKGDKGGDSANDTPTAKIENAVERTARATEEHVRLKRKELDIKSFAAGGGELARMGVSAVELNGEANSEAEFGRKLAALIQGHMGFAVARRGVSRQRNDGRGLY
jgi:hypothetical protein